MVGKQEWRVCSDIVSFVILFSDDKFIEMVENVGIRNDLS